MEKMIKSIRKKSMDIGVAGILFFIMITSMVPEYIQRNTDYRIVKKQECDYVYYDRKLTAKDFEQFNHDTAYEEIVARVGKENGRWGYGGAIPYYELCDGTYAIVNCLPGTTLYGIGIVDKNQTKYVLLRGNEEIYAD